MMEPPAGAEVNVRADSWWLANTIGSCERCLQPTALFSIWLPVRHERQFDSGWAVVGVGTVIFHVEHLSPQAGAVLRSLSPHFRKADGAEPSSRYWLNHCQHCGAPQDDHWLHCEPGSAFLPMLPTEPGQIELHAIIEPIAACARGMSDGLPDIAGRPLPG